VVAWAGIAIEKELTAKAVTMPVIIFFMDTMYPLGRAIYNG